MSKKFNYGLENLVPPLELCKLIPLGEFADSAFIWVRYKYIEEPVPQILPREHDIAKFFTNDFLIYPAPTLEEILEELHKNQEDVFLKWSEYAYNEWLVNAYTHHKGEDYQAHNKSAATAALKVYLKQSDPSAPSDLSESEVKYE